MLLLIVGLVLFLGIHSTNILAPDFRTAMVGKLGLLGWKGLYAVIALIGFVLIVVGYAEARMQPTWLWVSPVWTRHLAALLMLPAFVLLVATYVPGTHLKARMGHPMLLATKIWALSHLIANGTLADVLLFGAFLAWAVLAFIILRRRDRATGKTYPAVGVSRDMIAVVAGVVLWAVFAMYLHRVLIGVGPFG